MEDWISSHEDKLKIASLIVALFVLLSAIYKWLLQKWRADVSLRKYAYLHELESREVKAISTLKVDVPVEQGLKITLSDSQSSQVLYEGQTRVGVLELDMNMTEKPAGEYELELVTDDQTSIKTIIWSGLDAV